MANDASDLSRRLSADALAVCLRYLSNGRREGRYWRVGDIHNTPGRSMFVRLTGPTYGPGAAGKWTDAATGEHGDLLDLLHAQLGAPPLSVTLEEARAFLSMPRLSTRDIPRPADPAQPPSDRARRLFYVSVPVAGTLAEFYLRTRAIRVTVPDRYLRFQPKCYYRPDGHARLQRWPALIAAVRDPDDHLAAVHRTYLARNGAAKAPFDEPRRALGPLLGNGVRLADIHDLAVIGEGLETMLSLLTVMPTLPVIAALSANHLSAYVLPPSVRRLYIAPDRDADGFAAANRLEARVRPNGIEVFRLDSRLKDWNHDLHDDGFEVTLSRAARQLRPEDWTRFDPRALPLTL